MHNNIENQNPIPRPLSERICACGCNNYFQPKRKDQIYLNKQHANFGYNHGKRKSNNKSRLRQEKILRKNDDLLDKHYKSYNGVKYVDVHYEILNAENFQFGYQVGIYTDEGIQYYLSYRYKYYFYKIKDIGMIKIMKR